MSSCVAIFAVSEMRKGFVVEAIARLFIRDSL